MTSAAPLQQQFTIARHPDGTYTIEVPGSANGARRKLDTQFGLALTIAAEFDRLATIQAEKDAFAARKAAQLAAERHERVVGYAAQYHPATLRHHKQAELDLQARHQALRTERALERHTRAEGLVHNPSAGEGI